MLNELPMAVRMLAMGRGFTVPGSATLAVCVAANVTLFVVVDHVLLRPLPIPEADRVLLMGNEYPRTSTTSGMLSAVADYYDRLRETTVFAEQALYTAGQQGINQNGTATRVPMVYATPSFFRVLGVAASLGRTFTEAEGQLANTRKVVLSHAFWHSAFAGDVQAVGNSLEVDGQPLEIVGVMPQGFVFLDPEVMFWRPVPFSPAQRSDAARHNNSFRHIGRLKPGATIEQARTEIDALNSRNLERFPQYKQMVIDSGFHTIVVSVQDDLVSKVKSALYFLWGGALFVLLIGCVNVAGLVLARSRARFKELATCMALGADQWQLARRSMVESCLLTVASGLLGVWLGGALLQLLARTNILDLPRRNEIHVDFTTIVLALGVTAAIGIALGLVRIAGAATMPLSELLREAGRGDTSGRGARAFRRGLVVVQTCVTFTLLVGAGLLLTSFARARAVNPG